MLARVKQRSRNRIVTGALVLLLVLMLVGAFLSTPPARADEAFRLPASSAPVGMATDHVRGRYWLLERTSGRLTLRAVAADGTDKGEMNSRDTLTNAQALAFESGEAYVGDVGGRRAEVVVHQITEPWPAHEILRALPHRLAYPDGPHDAAAIFVDAAHRIFVVTRGAGAGIYQAPENPSTTEASPLTRVADAPDGVTDAVALLDGRVALRTASELTVLDPASWTTLGHTTLDVPERGQSLTESTTPGELLIAAGPAGAVTRLSAPGPAPATPAPRPTAKASAPQSQASDPEANRSFEQTGTTFAIGAALVVALLAAGFVLVRR